MCDVAAAEAAFSHAGCKHQHDKVPGTAGFWPERALVSSKIEAANGKLAGNLTCSGHGFVFRSHADVPADCWAMNWR